MHTYTNLAWPDDPYRASQQLYPRPSPMLAAFAVLPAGQCPIVAPAAVAVAYLPLHRTRAITVTEDTLAFGFRAASTAAASSIPGLAGLADLDLMLARRHARFLAGYALPAGLRALRDAAPGLAGRGLAAVEAGAAGQPARGMATVIDIGDGHHDLAVICRNAVITASPASLASGVTPGSDPAGPAAAGRLAAAAAERALAIALASARRLGRYRWQNRLRTARVLAAAAWDLFPLAS